MRPPTIPLRLYSWSMDPEPRPEPHRLLPDAIQSLLTTEGEGPLMVTTWAVVAEYIDETGAAGVAAWASDDPQWRINGILAAAVEMLDVEQFDDEEIEDE